MDMHTLSTDCTGDHPAVPNRSRQIIPLLYMCGCMGMGRTIALVGLSAVFSRVRSIGLEAELDVREEDKFDVDCVAGGVMRRNDTSGASVNVCQPHIIGANT